MPRNRDKVNEMDKILIVEDEPDISENVELFLQHNGFETLVVDDGAKVVATVKQFKPALIVLDLMLPNKDGLSCCQDIREFSNVPIIMVTAKSEQVDKLLGLEVGADDYVCKPFDISELILRVKAILKRAKGLVSYSIVAINPQTKEATLHGQSLGLSALEFSLFELLFRSPERVYSRAQIIEMAYPDNRDITDRTVDSHVKNIRKKFKALGAEDTPIQSVYGAGYRYSASC